MLYNVCERLKSDITALVFLPIKNNVIKNSANPFFMTAQTNSKDLASFLTGAS